VFATGKDEAESWEGSVNFTKNIVEKSASLITQKIEGL
jgi:hypothetical protein